MTIFLFSDCSQVVLLKLQLERNRHRSTAAAVIEAQVDVLLIQ